MAMPGGRNGSQKWGGHQPNGMSRREDHWGDGGAYGFRGGLGDPLELRATREVEGAQSPAVEGASDAAATGVNPERLWHATAATTRYTHRPAKPPRPLGYTYPLASRSERRCAVLA